MIFKVITFNNRMTSNNIELQNIIYPRISPYTWDMIGYIGGLVALFYYNKTGIIIFFSLFILYGMLNMLFDFYSVSLDYTNRLMPNYKNIGIYSFYITNKKYALNSRNISKPLESSNMVDDSKLNIELTMYVGDYNLIKYTLFVIYILGITKKNYTLNDFNTFKCNEIFFV